MHLTYRNVNYALPGLVSLFTDSRNVIRRGSRNGPVLVIDEPVIITYSHPTERVLLLSSRDANPFFHLYEALWMLAGQRDVAPLAYYCSRMRGFSDDDITLSGAYGYRWQHSTGDTNQLDILADHLRETPTSRRAVLSMWNVEDDLLYIDASKDVCCNLCVVFAVRDGALDMTVFSRSNDLVWGLLGANAVHFSVLQEYMAARAGVGIGAYHHVTANLHVYPNRDDWGRAGEWLAPPGAYPAPAVPLVRDHQRFDEEVKWVVPAYDGAGRPARPGLKEPFLEYVAAPMFAAYRLHRTERETEWAIHTSTHIADPAWRAAAQGWLERRLK